MLRNRLASVRLSALVAAALVVVSAAVPLSASAHFEPGGLQALRWFWVNRLPGTQAGLHLLYDRDCIADWPNADAAASAWQSTPTPLYFAATWAGDCWTNHYSSTRPVGSGWQEGTISIRNGVVPGAALAYTIRLHCYAKFFTDSCWGWSITGYNAGVAWINDGLDAGLIYENHNGNYDVLTPAERQDTLKHEIGHMLGLEHAGYYGGETPGIGFPSGVYSIMDYCCPSDYGFRFPSGHDSGDVNLQYPGW